MSFFVELKVGNTFASFMCLNNLVWFIDNDDDDYNHNNNNHKDDDDDVDDDDDDDDDYDDGGGGGGGYNNWIYDNECNCCNNDNNYCYKNDYILM